MAGKPGSSAHVSLAEALLKGPPSASNLAVPIFAHGSLEVELYTPKGHDPQQPHDRDEVYLVARGSGVFFDGATATRSRLARSYSLRRVSLIVSKSSPRTSRFGCSSMVLAVASRLPNGRSLGE